MNQEDEPLTCSQEELIERLKQFPAEQSFQTPDKDTVVQWCNGHCFYWVRHNGNWECDEL